MLSFRHAVPKTVLLLLSVGAIPAAEEVDRTAGGLAVLLDRLTPEGLKALGVSPDALKPDGRELAEKILRPLAEGRGPLKPEQVEGEAKKWAASKDRLEALLKHRVSLLGGYPEQDLGKPIDWFRAPSGDLQWPTHLSRHYWLKPLACAWRATRDPKYSGAVIEVLLDWTRRTPLGAKDLQWGAKKSAGEGLPATAEGYFKGYCDGPWTSLSAHARVDYWSELLQLVWDAPQMTNANAAVLLESLVGDHRAMMLNHDRWGTANQFIAIAASLIRLSFWYPDFKDVAQAEKVGWERAMRFATAQVYPDGSMAECSPNYAVGSLMRLFDLLVEGQARGRAIPEGLKERVRLGMRYFVLLSDPAGRLPRIAKGREPARGQVRQINAIFGDPDAAWYASEGRESRPPATLCQLFPWAGHAVLRSGWDAQATWLFFEPGPRGSGHHDQAQLNVQLIANGEWLLTDPGYFSYSSAGEDGRMSAYLKTSAAHNVALVDGEGQLSCAPGVRMGPNEKPGEYAWSDTGEACSVSGAYAYGFGKGGGIKVTHRRRVTYDKKRDAFEIADTFEGAGKHRIDLHWQCPPKAKVTTGESSATIAMPRAQLELAFEAPRKPELTVHQGEKTPLRGWFSETYGKLEPAPTIRLSIEGDLPLPVTSRLRIERRAAK